MPKPLAYATALLTLWLILLLAWLDHTSQAAMAQSATHAVNLLLGPRSQQVMSAQQAILLLHAASHRKPSTALPQLQQHHD